jgi:hypothetical protein
VRYTFSETGRGQNYARKVSFPVKGNKKAVSATLFSLGLPPQTPQVFLRHMPPQLYIFSLLFFPCGSDGWPIE